MRTFLTRGCVLVLSAALGAAAFASCGGETPPPETPTPPPAPTAEPTAAATAEPEATAAPETPPPAETAEADAGAPKKPASSGRPPILKSSATEISDTFGSTPGAKLEIGDKDIAMLRIPEGALDRATNVTFKLDAKGKSGGGQVGKIYRITMIVPPATEPRKITSGSEPFELRLPAGNKKDANLAIGEITVDDKGREKIGWTIVAPVKIDDATNTAFYELPDLGGDMYLHVTTKAPTAPKQ